MLLILFNQSSGAAPPPPPPVVAAAAVVALPTGLREGTGAAGGYLVPPEWPKKRRYEQLVPKQRHFKEFGEGRATDPPGWVSQAEERAEASAKSQRRRREAEFVLLGAGR